MMLFLMVKSSQTRCLYSSLSRTYSISDSTQGQRWHTLRRPLSRQVTASCGANDTAVVHVSSRQRHPPQTLSSAQLECKLSSATAATVSQRATGLNFEVDDLYRYPPSPALEIRAPRVSHPRPNPGRLAAVCLQVSISKRYYVVEDMLCVSVSSASRFMCGKL